MSGKSKAAGKRVYRGVSPAEISLSLRSCLDSLFGLMETTGAGARRAAWDHLTGHLFETTSRLCALAFQKKDSVAAWRATQTLSVLFCRCIEPLIGIGSAQGDTIGKRWAGESLARVDVAVEKHRKTLGRANSTYRETKAKLGKLRRDIVAAPGPIGQIVQRELATTELYRDALLFYRRALGENWESLIATRIPREYWLSVELPDLTEKSEPQWWKFLWPLIKKNNPDLLVKLRAGKFPTLGIRRHARWSTYRKEFRNHLRTLARLRKGGVL